MSDNNKSLIDRLEKKYPPKRKVLNSLKQAEEAKAKAILPTPASISRKAGTKR